MNLSDGTRRLALGLGVVCAAFGGFGSFKVLMPIVSHYKFQALAGSETAQRERQWYMQDVQRERAIYLGKEAQLQTEMPVARRKDNLHILEKRQDMALRIQLLSIETSEELFRIEQTHSSVNRNGIRRIQWTGDYGVESIDASKPWPRPLDVEAIETQGGEILAPTPSPAAWEYVLIALFPVLGFLVGCGAVRAIAWGVSNSLPQSDRRQTQSAD